MTLVPGVADTQNQGENKVELSAAIIYPGISHFQIDYAQTRYLPHLLFSKKRT